MYLAGDCVHKIKVSGFKERLRRISKGSVLFEKYQIEIKSCHAKNKVHVSVISNRAFVV